MPSRLDANVNRKKTLETNILLHLFSLSRKPNDSNCPQCRKPINNQTIHPVFMDVNDGAASDQMLATQISSLSDLMKNRDSRCEATMVQMQESLERITLSMSAFEYQNQLLRQENEELKRKVDVVSAAPSNKGSGSKESHKAKDAQIALLLKENGELRAQRAETSREMCRIREQISDLKNSTKSDQRPLNGTEPRPEKLTLKFDNINDKL